MLSGPETITQAGQVQVIGDAISWPLRWEELSRDAREQLAEAVPGVSSRSRDSCT